MTSTAVTTAPAALRDLFREIGDLKRIRSADKPGSIAQRGFSHAWSALSAGASVSAVMAQTTAAALVAARLGDLDGAKLRELGLSDDETGRVLVRSFDEVAAPLDDDLKLMLRSSIGGPALPSGRVPGFVDALARQPRAGATCPGKPRLILEPPEDHAEHCWAVAVYGVILAPTYRADPETVFLAALAHHFHNASMPDSGFTGEMLLGDALDRVCHSATETALAELAPPLRDQVSDARRILPDANTPEGRAFHAADVVDRVLQIAQHLRAARTTMADVLDDLGLVHDGPVKPFHDAVLAEMGLP